MTYTVYVAREAEDTILANIDYIGIEKQSPVNALRVLERIEHAKQSLSTFPNRCPIAPDGELSPFEVRMLMVGSGILPFTVDDDAGRVNVIGFRHGRQMPIDLS